MSDRIVPLGTDEPGASRRRHRGRQTRTRIVAAALDAASRVGVSDVTIGTLAAATGMSKSGLFAHFGSSEGLALALLEAAEVEFLHGVWLPAQRVEPGRRRLVAVLDAWIGWQRRAGMGGGCPFVGAVAEYDDRPGPVRDHLAASQSRWRDALTSLVAEALARGELAAGTDPRDVACELLGTYLAWHWTARLLDDAEAESRARRALARIVGVPITAP
jgi:AcrR family transcriptional regulator